MDLNVINNSLQEIIKNKVYESDDFKKEYNFSGELGAIYSREKTVFRVWSPVAQSIKVKLYSEGIGDNLLESLSMIRRDKGVWSIEKAGDLYGVFYTYEIKVLGETHETQDIYSKAVGVNGDRSMVIDLSRTNPEGWDKDKGTKLTHPTDAIVYEVHLRDISIDENSGITMKGKYLGLTERGTKSREGEVTGLNHLKEMGVTHVQVLPFFDYATIDETRLQDNRYNWGYDPKNYQVPEGSYSTDPYSGTVRIKELKTMIKALHDEGIGVIMDSVYNHTFDIENSCFHKTVPGYYHCYKQDGTAFSTSGCGNDTASDRFMFRKYIIDSVCYWALEYHVDGFRFDLMGLHDIDTMNEIREALDKINPEIIMYGEPWNLGEGGIEEEKKATKDNMNKLNVRIGAFSDDMRDAIRGHVFSGNIGGFVNYNGKWMRDERGKEISYTMEELKELVKFGIVASTKHPGVNYEKVYYSKAPWALEPTQTVNYASCHDNNTLWDKLKLSHTDASLEELIDMDKMADFIVLTSQGIVFLHAGEEMLRSKPGEKGEDYVENSFKSPDSVNNIKWIRKSKYNDVVEYYKGLIKLRKEHPAFRMAKTSDIQNNLLFLNTSDSSIAYTIINHANGDKWENIVVLINAGKVAEEIILPKSHWTVVVNKEKSGTEALDIIMEDKVIIPGRSSMVLVDSQSYNLSDS